MAKGMHRIWMGVCAMLMAVHSSAQPKATAIIQPERIETGDTATLTVYVSGVQATPGDVDFAAWARVLPPSNILHRYAWRKTGAQWARRFTLIAFDSAMLELPALRVEVPLNKVLETNALKLSVYPSWHGKGIENMADIRDLKSEPEHWTDYWPYGAGFTGLLLLLCWWLRRRKPAPVPVQAPVQVTVPLSPATVALEKIAQLEQQQLWKKEGPKAHYSALSLILREYIEARFRIPAMESTTMEIERMLGKTDFPGALKPLLKTMLHKADMVKYARSEPADADYVQVLHEARELIELRTPAKTQSAPKQHTKPSSSGNYEPL